jgi:hypothetical protein
MTLVRRLLLAAVVAPLGIAAGCRTPGAARSATAAGAPTVLLFSNQSQYEAGVYLVQPGGVRRRLGTVMPGRTDSLLIRPGVVPVGSTVAIVARLLARSDVPSTGPFALRPGDRYVVTLPPQANILSLLPATDAP